MATVQAYLDDFAAKGMLPTAPYEAMVDIAAPPEVVWAAISAPGNLTNIHPFCERNPVVRWPGPASLDTVEYFSGLAYRREFLDWTEGKGYDIALGPPGRPQIAIAQWSLDGAGDGGCRFGIVVTSFVRADADPDSRARYEATVIGDAIPRYLDPVVKGVAHFCETGTPVERNQFGPHEIYSPAL